MIYDSLPPKNALESEMTPNTNSDLQLLETELPVVTNSERFDRFQYLDVSSCLRRIPGRPNQIIIHLAFKGTVNRDNLNALIDLMVEIVKKIKEDSPNEAIIFLNDCSSMRTFTPAFRGVSFDKLGYVVKHMEFSLVYKLDAHILIENLVLPVVNKILANKLSFSKADDMESIVKLIKGIEP